MRIPVLFTLCASSLLAACSPQAPAPDTPPPAPAPAEAPLGKQIPPATDAWLGNWPSIEGNFLEIDVGDAPGRYKITEGTLDGPLSYDGMAQGETIKFEHGGKPLTIRAGTGVETDLKWLAEKQNCLIIESGRGFCRD